MSHDQGLQLVSSKEASDALLTHFLDINLFPEIFSQSIVDYIKCVSLEDTTKQGIISKCNDYLTKKKDANPVLTQRAIKIKQILEPCDKVKDNELSNLIISEIDITGDPHLKSQDNKQEGDLSNLVIEEVDFADYM